jgi:murein DD-endopeptidase MepM/ murein hydrolase activator NlpD
MRASSIFFTLALIATLESASAQPPSLTGTWIPDPAASTQSKELKKTVQPGAAPAPPAPPAAIQEQLPPMRIQHREPRLTLEFLDADGSVISTTEITTDGKENLSTRAGGALTHRSNSRWDGKVLKTDWKLEQQKAVVVISGQDQRELTSPDTLVVTATAEDSKSTSRSVIVYHRGKKN